MKDIINTFNYHTDNAASATLSRNSIDDKYKWNLCDIYQSDELWENDFKWVDNNLIRFKEFEGRLGSDPQILVECLKFNDSICSKVDRLYLYSMLSKDSDIGVSKYLSMNDRIKGLFSKVAAVSSYIRPEILSLNEEKLFELVKSNTELNLYHQSLKDLFRTKKHTLKKEEEEILALAGEIVQNPYNSYSIFTNSELQFPSIRDDKNNEIEITHARYYAALYSKDRGYRERAFKSYLSSYKKFANTFTSLFNGNLRSHIFESKARKYSSAREASLDRNNIPVSVYDNLIEAVNNNLQPMHRWSTLKKQLLNISEFHPYDGYVTIFETNEEKKYSYEEAKSLVLKSLEVMGEDYLKSLETAFENRWIDVYETPAKKSGAYSSGTTFSVHPYVLLNWTDLLNDVFTLTHEMGHNMHSYYTGVSQPYPYANYSIFLAEVASTFNEALLLEYLISVSSSKEEKLFLLEKYLNNITTTFYRQVMFAEFEMDVYKRTEAGEALTSETLREIYGQLYKKYWGPEMIVDEEEEYTWARVPHFYYNFYVFQYATGYAASMALVNQVQSEGKETVKKYLDFLKAGSSDYPINILKNAGVDMNSPEPVLAVTKKMNEILDEIESLLKK